VVLETRRAGTLIRERLSSPYPAQYRTFCNHLTLFRFIYLRRFIGVTLCTVASICGRKWDRIGINGSVRRISAPSPSTHLDHGRPRPGGGEARGIRQYHDGHLAWASRAGLALSRQLLLRLVLRGCDRSSRSSATIPMPPISQGGMGLLRRLGASAPGFLFQSNAVAPGTCSELQSSSARTAIIAMFRPCHLSVPCRPPTEAPSRCYTCIKE
jgi:hypothetical protein